MTIQEIAKLAGVSAATVSRYFNDGYVSEEKKSAIAKVVEETGYRPSPSARTLRTKRTNTIGVIIPTMDSWTIGRVVSGIMNRLEGNGYRILIANTGGDIKKENEYIRVFGDQQVDGILLFGTRFIKKHRKTILKTEVPIVVIGQFLEGCYCVYHDDYWAMYDMTEYFIGKGRKKIGMIGVTFDDMAVGKERYKGWKDALKKNGLALEDDQFVKADFSIDSGYEKMGELYGKLPELDAVICATDHIAVGAVKYLKDAGVKVPDVIIVSGQGDSELASVSSPSITTIHYHYQYSGQVAAELILRLLEGENIVMKEIKLPCEIVKKESTADGKN